MHCTLPRSATLALCLLAACEPPPIPTDGETGDPSITVLFPESAAQGEVAYCPSLIVVVDISGYELDPSFPDRDEENTGHWHIKDNDAYVTASGGNWLQIDLEPGEHRLTAVLASNTHDETEYSDAVEIFVEDIDGCVGGAPGADTGTSG
jgi:hypothetical protein